MQGKMIPQNYPKKEESKLTQKKFHSHATLPNA
jgi:hypothetical protein